MNDSPKILIIDDSLFEQELTAALLAKHGFESKCISSGVGVVKIIQEYRPNLVLLDINLPDFSGEKILKEIRAEYNSVSLPVIMLSGTSTSEKIVEMLKLGANDYVTKPFVPDVTMARVETQINISCLNQELSKLKERDTIQAMVATYNHEINNPLMIAIGSLNALKKNPTDEKKFLTLETALKRIAEITKKIKVLHAEAAIEAQTYLGDLRIYKIK